jgi:hypothetical protein
MLRWRRENVEKGGCLLLIKRWSLSTIALSTNLGYLISKVKTEK